MFTCFFLLYLLGNLEKRIMKKYFYLFIILFSFTLVSCEKEELEDDQPVEEVNTIEDDTIRIYGKYLLLSGKMYVTNLVTNEKIVYDHFDANKTVSSLRYGGSQYEIEDIEKNVTTWEITPPPHVPGYGEFILNGDVVEPYGFYVTRSNWTIVEHPNTQTQQIGGSSRPLDGYLVNKSDSTVVFRLQETYENINGYNSKYVSELTFKKIKN